MASYKLSLLISILLSNKSGTHSGVARRRKVGAQTFSEKWKAKKKKKTEA